MDESSTTIAMTAKIVAAYVGGNQVTAADLPVLIRQVHDAVKGIERGAVAPLSAEAQKPAVPIRRSITPDFLISLEDGKQYKSLTRHLAAKYGMTPADYRAKWGLPNDYPMVAPNHAAERSALAKRIGLGQSGRRKASAPVAAPAKRSRKSAK